MRLQGLGMRNFHWNDFFFFFFLDTLGYEVLRMFSSQKLTVLTLYGGNYFAVNSSSKQSNLKEL